MVDELKSRVIANARRRLLELGIPQRELCRRAGVSWGVYRRSISTRDEGMSTGSILALAQVLDVDAHYLTSPL
jgi:transcriptional regulator with XRE-family HTH domain